MLRVPRTRPVMRLSQLHLSVSTGRRPHVGPSKSAETPTGLPWKGVHFNPPIYLSRDWPLAAHPGHSVKPDAGLGIPPKAAARRPPAGLMLGSCTHRPFDRCGPPDRQMRKLHRSDPAILWGLVRPLWAILVSTSRPSIPRRPAFSSDNTQITDGFIPGSSARLKPGATRSTPAQAFLGAVRTAPLDRD